ncbi:PREDICTED: 60S ribosomal protein L4-like [Elephantulus edwardii]|uniref:60S ribosomal protein L4-like n=1 Tax=Elephantulus edwardii TaxID=28737 RepID=UPI0003F0C014|nr:PREDICTED: 60S ribosomal protein L4-like [Elephantulus edwardii]
MQDDSSQSPEEEPTENLRITLKLNPYAKTMHQNTILCQSRNHKLQKAKATVAQEAKSLKKGLPPSKKPVVGKKGGKKAAVDVKKKPKKPVVGKKAAATKKPAGEKQQPVEKKPALEEKSAA